MDLLDQVRRSPLHRAWRALKAPLQVGRFEALVAEARRAATCEPSAVQEALAGRARSRRSLPRRPRILAFGARQWEANGFWQAFQHAAGTFDLYEYQPVSIRLGVPGGATRRALGRDFLRALERPGPAGAPDLVFLYASGAYVDPEVVAELGRRGIWTVAMSLDDKQQLPGRPLGGLAGWQLELAQAVDLYWTTWRTGVDWLWARGSRPWYAPEGACPDHFKPVEAIKDLDVLWLGRGYGPRHDLVRHLRRLGFTVEARGPGWESGAVDFEDLLRLYSRARVVLGMGGVGHTDEVKHLKGRDFEAPMSGAAYLTSYNPELADHFEIGREILCYASPAECADVLAWGLHRPNWLASVGVAGRARCLRDHTWDRRVADLLALLGRPA